MLDSTAVALAEKLKSNFGVVSFFHCLFNLLIDNYIIKRFVFGAFLELVYFLLFVVV